MPNTCTGHPDCNLPVEYPGGLCRQHAFPRPVTTVDTPNGKVSVGMCPACGKSSTYDPKQDRFYHMDGSNNDPCWLKLLRGSAGGWTAKHVTPAAPIGGEDMPDGFDPRYDDLYLTRDDLGAMPEVEPLIDGVIDRHTLFVIAGRDQTYKSFLALDWLCCLATGKSWQGREVEKCGVMYVVGEGAWGLHARVNAWETAHGEKVNWLTVRRAPVNLFKQASAFADLLARIEDIGIEIVVFDTLQRMSAGADQNSARDAGTIIEGLDRVRQVTNGAVGVVAHTDKGDNDTRGSSAFEDDADIVWRTRRDEDEQTIHLSLAKRKDGPAGLSFDLRPRMVDGTGSLVLESAKSFVPHPDRPPAQAWPVLRALGAKSVPTSGLSSSALKEAIGQAGKGGLYRSLDWLMDAGYVRKEELGRWPSYSITGEGQSRLAETLAEQG